MPTNKGIFWLSSYPKSGNTWFRILLSKVLNQDPSLHPISHIDSILGSPMVTNRGWLNQIMGIDSHLLTEEEIEQIRPQLYQWHAKQLQRNAYIKTHDAYTLVNKETPLIPGEGCLGVVYFVRNPLDVAVSLAHYVKCPIDWSIHMMGNADFFIPLESNKNQQIRQKLLSWSLHVQSWVSNPNLKILVLRYEDMLAKPFEIFSQGMAFLNLSIEPETLQNAITETAFDKLQQFEKTFGFKERLGKEGPFFRKGIAGDWRSALTDRQVQKIIEDHKVIMRQYSYLDARGNPV